MKKQTIRDAFNDANISDTRHFMLEDGLRTLHRAFAECDTYNRAKIIEQFPFIAQAAKFYGTHSTACNTFEHDGIEMPEDVDARVREILDNI